MTSTISTTTEKLTISQTPLSERLDRIESNIDRQAEHVRRSPKRRERIAAALGRRGLGNPIAGGETLDREADSASMALRVVDASRRIVANVEAKLPGIDSSESTVGVRAGYDTDDPNSGVRVRNDVMLWQDKNGIAISLRKQTESAPEDHDTGSIRRFHLDWHGFVSSQDGPQATLGAEQGNQLADALEQFAGDGVIAGPRTGIINQPPPEGVDAHMFLAHLDSLQPPNA